ncbi:MAG TPA: sulfotransferase family protein [Microlunatus sp.]
MITDSAQLRNLLVQRRSDDSYRTWGYHSRVSPAHRYVCVPVPKVACTTTKTVLRSLEGLPPSDRIHDEGDRLADFSIDQNIDMLRSPAWLRFSFVRNPYARLYSAYKSKIGNTWEHQYDWLQRQIRDAYDYPIQDGVRTGMINFDDFVRFVAESSDPRVGTDGHLAPQVAIVQQDCIDYDTIGRFETFQTDFTAILTRLDASAAVVDQVTKIINPTPYAPLTAVYRRALAATVYALYEADFETWGYPRRSWLAED